MEDLAGFAGVGPVFVREVERGKQTVPLGRVIKLLGELGIRLQANVPAEVAPRLQTQQLADIKPLTRRKLPAPRTLQEDRTAHERASF